MKRLSIVTTIMALSIALFSSCANISSQKMEEMTKAKNVLIVLTSHEDLGNTGNKTGFWLEEFAGPYYLLTDRNAVAVVLVRSCTYFWRNSSLGIPPSALTGWLR